MIAGQHWVLSNEPPFDWVNQIKQAGGGFFHCPPALLIGGPPGQAIFASLSVGSNIHGVALGLRTRCRLSIRHRHYYFPTLPAVSSSEYANEALMALVSSLTPAGAAELVFDSFDAGWEPAVGIAVPYDEARLEYTVYLDVAPDKLFQRLGKDHQRLIRRGERESWELRMLQGAEAVDSLAQVQTTVLERAQRRGSSTYSPGLPTRAIESTLDDLSSYWGLRTFAAHHGDRLLSAALVGWGNGHAYYILGGSTPIGYQRSSAPWLHWKILLLLAEHGHQTYNFGGTRESAADRDNASHGLFLFKSRFGAQIRRRRGARWEIRPSHLRLHRVARWVRTQLLSR